jgi:hypothetical protein
MLRFYLMTLKIPLDPPFSKGEVVFFLPLEKGGREGFILFFNS